MLPEIPTVSHAIFPDTTQPSSVRASVAVNTEMATGTPSAVSQKDEKENAWKRHGAADLNQAALGGVDQIQTFGRHFVDGYGRILQMRGMNVSGASKLPAKPDGLASLTPEEFYDHESVSFVGRPFPLSDAPFHLSRLQAWGHTLVRLLVTWESLSHAGPDPEADIDLEYVEYLDKLTSMMPQFGIKVIVCAHQDVWSRFSGGSGAPAWTFAKAGLDIEAFRATGAAYVAALSHQSNSTHVASPSSSSSSSKREPVGAFVWPSGYQKLAAATMATLFWAGERFAWNFQVPNFGNVSGDERVNIQEYLQASYIETFGRLMDTIGGREAVLGFDLINEPHRGYIGQKDWHNWCYETDLHIGHFPSMIQGMALASGHKQSVPFYKKSWPFPTRRSHMSTIDPLGKSAWLPDSGMGECIWRAHGAWQWDEGKNEPVILSEDYFARDPRPGKERQLIEWYRDCYAPFIKRFTERLRRKHNRLFFFVEPIPNEFFPPWSSEDVLNQLNEADKALLKEASLDQSYATKTIIDTPRPSRFVYAPHFYDLNVLFGKVHGMMSVNVQSLSRGGFILNALFFGVEGLKKNYRRQISTLIGNGTLSLGSVPTIIGEVGIPFDINSGHALRTGDYMKQTELLDALIEAMEQAQVGFTLWNYNPDNKTDVGDGWNLEDFSVVCNEDHALDIDNVCHRQLTSTETAFANQEDDDSEIDETLAALHAGGRALPAILRPYAAKIAGFPLRTSWDREKLLFELDYVNAPTDFVRKAVTALPGADSDDVEQHACTTKVFLPRFHFDGYDIDVHINDGTYHIDRARQTLSVKHINKTPGFTHTIRVRGREPAARNIKPEHQTLTERRRAVRLRHRKANRFPLSASDTCSLLAVALALVVTLVLSQILANVLQQQ